MVNDHFNSISKHKVLITGGGRFIGSNICITLLDNGNKIRCLDNFAMGKIKNIEVLLSNPNFEFLKGDIRDLETCKKACDGLGYVLYYAALGSVPRSLKDTITSNDVKCIRFLNMLVAACDAKVKRFVYIASSSSYGNSENIPKVKDIIGKPLSPYKITKYVNEFYADIYSKTYELETIGLRYFNVFGRKQDPNGVYAAVIPKFKIQLMKHETPIIN